MGSTHLGAYLTCEKCRGSGAVVSHLNPYDGPKVGAGFGTHRCTNCGGRGKVYDFYATRNGPASPGAKTKPVVWLFGILGALYGGVLQPFGTDWFVGAVLGFVGAGMAAGFLNESRIGRIVLGVIGFALVAIIAAGIVMSGEK